MLAMNYNSYGMAYADYLTDGSGVTLGMGLFSGSPGTPANQYGWPLPGTWATTNLCEFNNRDTNWQNYIYGREQVVSANFAFDGWQMMPAPVTGASSVHALFVVFKNAASNPNWFGFDLLPSPWLDQDIGAVGLAGSALCTSGTFMVAGSGADIEVPLDALHFVFQNTRSCCELRARVTAFQNPDSWVRAGVMIRESTNAAAASACVAIVAGNGVEFQQRAPAGGGAFRLDQIERIPLR